jgi:hypothetical protein
LLSGDRVAPEKQFPLTAFPIKPQGIIEGNGMNTDEYRKQALKFILNQPKLTVSDIQWDRARLSWDFLRLNSDYKSECESLGIVKISESLPQHNEWGLAVWINPNLSFDDLFKIANKEVSGLGLEENNKIEASKFMVLHYLGRDLSQAVQRIDSQFGVVFKIDPNAPDSQIIKELKEWLKKLRGEVKKDRERTTLTQCYQAITLKLLHKKTKKEIADIMFPEPDFSSENAAVPDLYKMTGEDDEISDLNEEATMKKINRYLKIGNDLVNGGYKDI